MTGILLPAIVWTTLAAPPASPETDADLFRTAVLPLLRENCARCHNAQTKRGGLDVTTKAALLRGGDDGPVLVPGNAGKSRLLDMVSGATPKMPRQGKPLTMQQLAHLRRWIDGGAPWPDGVDLVAKDWWSLAALARPAVPTVKDAAWVRTPVDAFVLARLEKEGLKPSPEADRLTLIRRVTFDLHGLPPTPAEIDAFFADKSPDAWEKVVDRLLASPRYGERWGRQWLDLAHYADTHGYDKDKRRDHAWPYRDYVIRALNQDRPYARFVKEQLAGDVLAPDDPDAVAATGFLAAGPWDFVGQVELREGTVDKEKTRSLDRDDLVRSTAASFLGLTVGCARCHDHKFDPIPQADYYRLQAVFAGVDRGDRPLPDPKRRELLARQERLEAEKKELFSPQQPGQADVARLEAALKVVRAELSALPQVYAVVSRAPRPVHLLHRGDVEQKKAEMTPGALTCVPGLDANFAAADNEGARRLALATWIVDSRNPLTWRAAVNRVWHGHFGRALADTPADLGRNGSLPTHPELLDWLAVEFRDHDGSFKHLHRLLVTSAVYRQVSRHNEAAAAVDGDNRLLWRMNRIRLDAESVRDAVLSVSGALDLRMGGPGFEPFRFKDDHSPIYDHGDPQRALDPSTFRRSVYRFSVRSVPHPLIDCLDGADPNINTPVRNTTLTALQALALLNDPFMVRQSELFAGRLKKVNTDPGKQAEDAFRLTLGRKPTEEEREAWVGYARKHGVTNACRLLFNLNEFMFVD